MRKMVLLAVMMALAAMMLAAAPTSAQTTTSFFERGDDDLVICDFDDDDGDNFDECEDINVFRDFDFEDGIFSQETEQEAESGDVDQSFDVSSSGDNSNQCVGTQGVANTGNTQTAGSFDLLGGDFDDFDFDEVDSSIEVSPTSETTCDEEVNQAASVSG